MKKALVVLLFFSTLYNVGVLKAQQTITFLSKDMVIITADLYLVNDTLPYMILCHQAGFSRGEYKETAIKFTKFGYNCIALDARSGEGVNGIKNETAFRAKQKNKSTDYIDAEQDIISAIEYAYRLNKKKVILVGSSYSASLALKIGTTNNLVKAVVAFSPGEYFGAKLNLKETIKPFNKGLFVTSTLDEATSVGNLIRDIKTPLKLQFIPTGHGEHGSKALWEVTPNYHEYWLALLMFMRQVK
ncbi:MAG: dienelactone hydrolase family protein [Bacteroidetes bacterium]|nr:dienelactone hydrolase family protein [Bacteroidota bacterium]